MPASRQRKAHDNDIESKIALERIQNLYLDSKSVAASSAIGAILIGAMLWTSQPQQLVMLWVFAHLLIGMLRGVILYPAYKNRMDHLSEAMRWARLYAGTALISGIAWGALPWLLFDPHSTYNVSTIIAVILGIAAVSSVTFSAYPVVFFCYALPSLGGLFARLISEEETFTYSGILLYFLFIVFIHIQTIRIYRIITSSIRKKFENVALMRNLENKKREADQANIDKSRFLAATSHDLRQPLHALDLYLGSLEISLKEDLQKNLMTKVKKSSQSVGELLNALLDISRLDAGEVQINLQDIPLSVLFMDIKSEWSPQLKEKGQDLRIFPIQDSLITDHTLLLRMLGNVISNAIQHTNGNVLVGCRRRNGNIRLEVWDQGNGIPAHAQEQVFTEYFQLNNPERDRTKGLGLGLATVKRLSVLMNHPVNIRSFPGSGMCFSIDVPRALHHNTSIDVIDSFKFDLAGNFVLIIDDEEAIRDSLQILLLAWGCEVLVAESGDGAIEEMLRDAYPSPDAIITDYRLRENEAGVDAASKVMALFEKKIPTLIVTGDTDSEIASRCDKLGYLLIHKPLSSDKLLTTMQKLLSTQ